MQQKQGKIIELKEEELEKVCGGSYEASYESVEDAKNAFNLTWSFSDPSKPRGKVKE